MSLIENGLNATTDIAQIFAHLGPVLYLILFYSHKEPQKWYANHLLTGWLIVSAYVAINMTIYELTGWGINNDVPYFLIRLVCCVILSRIMYRADQKNLFN
jgi:hypothetical protein